jgi:hypothetical protein
VPLQRGCEGPIRADRWIPFFYSLVSRIGASQVLSR